MIKANVEIDKKSWQKKIKNPKKYFSRKLKILSKMVNFFKNKNIVFTILLTNSSNIKKLNKKLIVLLVLICSISKDLRLIYLKFFGIILSHMVYGWNLLKGLFSSKLSEEK